jgi:hypothetical protein
MPSTRTLERVADATGLTMRVVFAEKKAAPVSKKKLSVRLVSRKRATTKRRASA